MKNKVLFFVTIFLLIHELIFCQNDNFDSLKLDIHEYNDPKYGYTNVKIKIDKSGILQYTKILGPIRRLFTVTTEIDINGKFTNKEFLILKNRLTILKIDMNKDALCGPNMPINHFEVILNNKDIKAWGCIFYFLPKEFLDYLITIDLNPEIQNKHCKYVRHMKKIWRMIFPGKPESISI